MKNMLRLVALSGLMLLAYRAESKDALLLCTLLFVYYWVKEDEEAT